jgi:hypothetical protein
VNPWLKGFLQALSGAVVVLILLSLIEVPAVVGPEPRSPSVKEMSNLKQVVLILRQYARDHDGAFPAHIDDVPPGLIPVQVLQFHNPSTHEARDWLYFAGHTTDDPPSTLLAASPVPFRVGGGFAQRIVVFLDDSAKIMREEAFQRLLAAQRK